MARKPTKRTVTKKGPRPAAKPATATPAAEESVATPAAAGESTDRPTTVEPSKPATTTSRAANTAAKKKATVRSKSEVGSTPKPEQSDAEKAPAPAVPAGTGKASPPPVEAATPDPVETPPATPSAKPPEMDPVQATAATQASPLPASAQPAAPEPVIDIEPASDLPSAPPAAKPAQPAPEQRSQPVPPPPPEHIPEHVPEPPPVHQEPQPRDLFIVHITPEMAPVAKVGGLADVVFGLSRELAIRGNHVEIILPKYDNLRWDHIYNMHPVYEDLWVPWFDGAIHCTVHFSFVHDRKCFFIEPHSGDNFFNRGALYGFKDDVARFAFFSRAAIEFLWKSGKHPDLIHCHDWQTALVPVFLYEIYQQLGMHHPRVCLTIHNFKHQGVTGQEILRATGLNQPERFMHYERMGDNHHPGAINLLKGGIVYSNFVTTVSPRYAFETKDQGQGFGLEPTLHTHHMKYGGVVNGVDYDVWNPEVDHHLPVRYGVGSIDGKYDNKRALRHRLMMADNEKPIVAFIGRLDPQKGLELVRHAIFYALERGAQFVLLGSSPDEAINRDFWGLKHMLNDSPDCHLELGFDEDLSHLIYAGSDIMIVPSQFEPCGLTQLVALRYGTIPVVRSVGGLADTVFDKDHSLRPLHERNGYSFDTYDAPGLESALGRAIACYFEYPEHFRELIINAMRSDNSWNHPGQDYLNIYDFIRNR